MLRRQLHRLIDCSGIRDSIHKQQLISPHPEEFPDERLHLAHFSAGIGIQNKIKRDSAVDATDSYTLDKSFLLRS